MPYSIPKKKRRLGACSSLESSAVSSPDASKAMAKNDGQDDIHVHSKTYFMRERPQNSGEPEVNPSRDEDAKEEGGGQASSKKLSNGRRIKGLYKVPDWNSDVSPEANLAGVSEHFVVSGKGDDTIKDSTMLAWRKRNLDNNHVPEESFESLLSYFQRRDHYPRDRLPQLQTETSVAAPKGKKGKFVLNRSRGVMPACGTSYD